MEIKIIWKSQKPMQEKAGYDVFLKITIFDTKKKSKNFDWYCVPSAAKSYLCLTYCEYKFLGFFLSS
jgi:hypothetical protein